MLPIFKEVEEFNLFPTVSIFLQTIARRRNFIVCILDKFTQYLRKKSIWRILLSCRNVLLKKTKFH